MFERRLYFHVDWLLLGAIMVIVGIGVAMIYSTTYVNLPTGGHPGPQVRTQMYALAIGTVALLVCLAIDYRMLAEHSVPGSANTMLGYQGRRPSLYALTEQMQRINVPTLILAGDEEEPCLEACLLMKRCIATAGLALLPMSGHAINLEEPALFNQLLADFLHRVDAGRWAARDPVSKPASVWGPNGQPRG